MMRDDVEASWTCCVTEVQIRNPRLVRWRVRVEPLKPIIKKKLVVKKKRQDRQLRVKNKNGKEWAN